MKVPIIAPKSKARIIMHGDSFLSSGNFGDLLVYFASLNKIELTINAVTYNNKSTDFDYGALDLVYPMCRKAETSGFEYVKTCNTETFNAILGNQKDPADLLMLQAPRGEIFSENADTSAILDAYSELCRRFKSAYPHGKILFIVPPAFDSKLDRKYFDKWDSNILSENTQKQLIADFAKKLADSIADSCLLDMQAAYDYFAEQKAEFSLTEDSFRHPSLMGSYFNSCVAFAEIFGKSCANIGFFGVLPQHWALKLQNIAHRFVFGTEPEKAPLKTKMLPHIETPDPRFENETIPETVKPLLATAKAGFNRGAYFQYDMDALDQVVKTGSWRREMRIHPESVTPQRTRHIDCSCFVHNCFYTTYDHRLEKADDTKGMIARKDLYVFYWDAQTGENAGDAADRLVKTIKPGDAIVFRKHNERFGHTMLYIGNGWLLHSTSHNFSGSSGNYDFVGCSDNRELVGTVRYDEIDLFIKPYGERYMFGPTDRVALLRPTEKLGLTPSSSAVNRMNNLDDILSYKLTSAPQGVSVNPGEEVTFTFVLKNLGSSTKTVEIDDELSEQLTLKSACGLCAQNGKLNGTLTVAPGETKQAQYTVTLSQNAQSGSFILCSKAYIGKVKTNDTDIYVDKTLTAQQQTAVKDAACSAKTCRDGLELAAGIYKNALDFTLPIDSLESIQSSVFVPCASNNNEDHFCINQEKNQISRMLVPYLIGGKAYHTPREEHINRLRLVHKDLFITGDLLVLNSASSLDTAEIWICIGENEFASAKNGKITKISGFESFRFLDAVLGKKTFCVLRPSLIMQ